MWSPSWRRPKSASVEMSLRRNKRRMVVFTQCHHPQIHDFYGWDMVGLKPSANGSCLLLGIWVNHMY